MKGPIKLIVLVHFALLLGMVGSPTGMAWRQSLTLDQILNRMDQRGATLKSMSSSISQRRWTDILEEFDGGESGYLHFLKEKDKVYLRKDIPQPQRNTLIVRDGEVLYYQPKIKQLQKYNLGKNKDRAEFLLLGFGSDKQVLQNTYDIRLIAKEEIHRVETYQLELTPISDQVSAFFSKINLWIDTTLWVPIQQKLVEPTGDYLLINFSDIELNAEVPRSKFDLKISEDVRIVGQ